VIALPFSRKRAWHQVSTMRIEPLITIRVSARAAVSGLFAGMGKGAEVSAHIIERLGGRDALIEIAGKRIHAEFLKGVPAGSVITLKLDDVKNNSYLFKLVDPGGKEALAKQLTETTIFSMDQINKSVMARLSGALSKHPAGLYELNALLLGIQPKQDKKEGDRARFLGHLLKLGVNKNTVMDISLLLSGLNFSSTTLKLILSLMGYGDDRIRKWTEAGRADIEATVDSIIAELDSIPDEKDSGKAIQELIAYLRYAEEKTDGHVSGEFTLFNENEAYAVKFLGKDDTWLFSIDFSNIGKIEILARSREKIDTISIFCGNNDIGDLLESNKAQLFRELMNKNNNTHINFHNTRNMLNKIVEIYSYSSLNSVFDIKV